MNSVHLEIRRDDLRALVKYIEHGDIASVVDGLADMFVHSGDIELQTFGCLLDEIEDLPDGLPDDD